MSQEVVAKLNNLRIAPRKVRLVADLIRGQEALRAKNTLAFSAKAASRPFAKLLDSALANARNNFHLDEQNLYIATILVNEGAKLKRWRPRSRGRAFHIQKKVSHLTIILKEGAQLAQTKSRQIEKEEKAPAGGKEKPLAKSPDRSAKARPRTGSGQMKLKTAGASKRIFRRKAF